MENQMVQDAHTAGPSLAYIAEPLRHLAVPIETLTLDPANARKHDQRNLDAIAGSLTGADPRFPIVARRKCIVARAGNRRLIAAKAMGWTQSAALAVDESGAEAVRDITVSELCSAQKNT